MKLMRSNGRHPEMKSKVNKGPADASANWVKLAIRSATRNRL